MSDLAVDKDFKRALNYVFLLLRYRSRSAHEIRSRLRDKGFSSGVIDEVVRYLEEYRFIDDEAFVRSFVLSSIQKGWGPRKIAYALKRFGIAQPLRQRVLADNEQYRQKLYHLIEKKKDRYKNKKNPYQNLVRFFLGRGFRYSDIVRGLTEAGVKKDIN